jgi:hypothetical protein
MSRDGGRKGYEGIHFKKNADRILKTDELRIGLVKSAPELSLKKQEEKERQKEYL